MRFAFFGTGRVAEQVLDELEKAHLIPDLVVTAPDKPKGRGLEMTPSLVAQWAAARSVRIQKPEKLTQEWREEFAHESWDVCVVADYGKILSEKLLAIPKCGFVNVHPSLLPRLRGPSPIRSAILHDEKKVGVSVMLLDKEMDHGPIIARQEVPVPEWPPHGRYLDEILPQAGGALLAHVLPQWVEGTIAAHEQDHSQATYCRQFAKEDGLIHLADDPYTNLLKIRAFEGWPGTYTYFERADKRIRVAITDAHLDAHGTLILDKVIPEGKKEMEYEAFARSGAVPIT